MAESKHTPGPWFVFPGFPCVGGPHELNGTAGIAMGDMHEAIDKARGLRSRYLG